MEIEQILAGNIFHRAVAFGPRVETRRARSCAHPRERRGAAHGPGRGDRQAARGDGRGGGGAARRRRRGAARRATGSSPGSSPRPTRPRPATSCGSSSRHWGAWSCASRSIRRHEHDAATLPDALSDAARSFAAGPHRFVIGGERPEAADGRTLRDARSRHRPGDRRRAARGQRGRGPRGARGARGVRGRPLERIAAAERTRAMLALRRRGRRAHGRARGARVARQRQAGEDGAARGRAAHRRAPALLRRLAHPHQRRGAAGGAAEHALLHAQGAGRGGGSDHPVELPAADGRVEGGPGAGGGLHDRAEAGRADAADRAAPRRAGARGRAPRGRAQRDHGRRRDRRRAGGPSGRGQDRLHRLDRGRAARSAPRPGAHSSG